ncbi:Leucine aminopeptidase 1 [Physocladia obscura]|uniref:Peptide hydrolase n=1 Tax=Physocladia obscura TaxID=109957 RepID=A0AAD5XEX3_9FUNG|nr:Leucine aminopeptidase 1 [Physocladia obscura]
MLKTTVIVAAILGNVFAAVLPLQKLAVQGIDAHIPLSESGLALQGFRLIATAPTTASWMSEEEILALKRQEIGFMDITNQDIERVDHHLTSLSASALPEQYAPPKKISHKNVVTPLFDQISIPGLISFLTQFSAFHTRYYQSVTGAQSADWLFEQVNSIKAADPSKVKVTVRKFLHPFGQFSTIARLERGADSENIAEPIVILGAHQDSANGANPLFGRAPGADDDGSGTVTILEAYRILIQSSFVPDRPIEFHWYAAEEGGLLGSQAIAAKYKFDNVNVAGMYQVDMTGYSPQGRKPRIAVITDYVDHSLTDFVRLIAREYTGIDVVDSQCGYACSDHGSWSKANYASAFTFESEFNKKSPFIHTVQDTVENVNFEHVAHFVKSVLGFAVELSLAKEGF